MKHYKNPLTNAVYAYESDGSQDAYIPNGLVLITEAEAAALTGPTPEEIAAAAAAAAQAAKDAADITSAKAYGKLTALKSMTPAQVQSWVAANVTNLAQAQDAIATLAIGVGILARRL